MFYIPIGANTDYMGQILLSVFYIYGKLCRQIFFLCEVKKFKNFVQYFVKKYFKNKILNKNVITINCTTVNSSYMCIVSNYSNMCSKKVVGN